MHFTNLSLPRHIFYKDKEERKRTIFKAIPSLFGCVFRQCWAVCAALAAGLLFTSLASKAPRLLGQEEAEGLFVIFSVFFFTEMTVHSSLVYSFIFHWCRGAQSLSQGNHRRLKAAKR